MNSATVMSELRVPFAVDNEMRLFSPETAEKGRNFFCPACRASVILKKGEIKVAHFAHKTSDTCSQETITHKTAKLLVKKAVEVWKSGKGDCPTVQRVCQFCHTSTNQPLPEKVDSVDLEFRLEDGSIADVALLSGGVVQAVVEIRVTHAVDEIKANRLSVPFIELEGFKVIENSNVWEPTIDNFKPLTCDKCKSNRVKFQAKIEQVAKANNLELPKTYYRYGFCQCWRCKREIVVFAWPRGGSHDDSAPKMKARPRTVQYCFSKTIGRKYWANTCPYCQSIQGDFFLYHEPEGPFFGVSIDEDSPVTFNKDMMRISVYAAYIGLI